jgi:AAHS family 4-hydroxybenzoate transporter-like MFS transporter
LLVYCFLTSWLPMLIHDSGYAARDATLISALFTLGGAAGVILAGWLMDRFEAHRVIAASFVATAVLMCLVGHPAAHALRLAPLTFLAGLCMNGALSSCPTLAARSYPTAGRTSGVASMLGVGRLGAMLGAAAGGAFLQLGLGFGFISGLLALPLVVSATTIALKAALCTPRTQQARAPS